MLDHRAARAVFLLTGTTNPGTSLERPDDKAKAADFFLALKKHGVRFYREEVLQYCREELPIDLETAYQISDLADKIDAGRRIEIKSARRADDAELDRLFEMFSRPSAQKKERLSRS